MLVGEDALKAILDVRSGGQVHLRNNDCTFPPNTVRVWTSNAPSFEDFLEGTGRKLFSGHSIPATVRRRTWVCQITERLLKPQAVANLKATSAANHATYSKALQEFMPP
jgi:hypothetical protein